MKTAALLILAALLAPAAFLAAHHADRRAWPALACAVLLLVALVGAVRLGLAW